jgi:CBS domain-containing protein
MRVRDTMSLPLTIGGHEPVGRAAEILMATRAPILAVVGEGGRYLGTIGQADLPTDETSVSLPVAAVLRNDVLVAHPDEGVWDLITILRLGELNEVAVVEDGAVVGVVTHHNLVRAIAREDDVVAADIRRRLGPCAHAWDVAARDGHVPSDHSCTTDRWNATRRRRRQSPSSAWRACRCPAVTSHRPDG